MSREIRDPFHIKKGALAPVYDVTLYDYYGTSRQRPLPLQNATDVRMKMRKRGAPAVFLDVPMIFVDKPRGEVRYQWTAGDTDAPGVYDVEFDVTWAGDVPETIPPDDNYLQIIIHEDLDA